MPILLWVGLGGLGLGAVGGFTLGGGAKAMSTGVKYAALGVAGVIAARQLGWLK